jgi:hypothetical protein
MAATAARSTALQMPSVTPPERSASMARSLAESTGEGD